MLRTFKITASLFVAFCLETYPAASQEAVLRGTARDSIGSPLHGVNVSIIETGSATATGQDGAYRISIPSDGREITVVWSFVGYRSESRKFTCDNAIIIVDIFLTQEVGNIGEVKVFSERKPADVTLTSIPVKELGLLPSASGSFEAILKIIPGVQSNNELSSQYRVRGGNFDENLVYVNDVEVFRPFLIRSGQQEGLSFINPDLVSSVNFSSGGFNASYGDKMSSVLDIRYKTPSRRRYSFSPGLLISSAHAEGISRDRRFTWLAGARYKSSRLMLKTLDSRGDYQPVFADIQSLFSLRTGEKSVLSLLATWSSNTYNYIPQSRFSSFGSEIEAYQLYVLFEGQEKDRYQTWNTVMSWEVTGNNYTSHKFLLTSFATTEKESFDIRGYYSLSSLDKEAGSENFSDTLMNIGIGSFLSHARNRLTATIQSVAYKGEISRGNPRLDWGMRIRHSLISDNLREWTKVDSAGYSIPYDKSELRVSRFISAGNNVVSWLGEAYAIADGRINIMGRDLHVSGGLRGYWNSFTGELNFSPRVSARYKPGRNLTFWLAGGMYYQPPFYREMRFPDGSLNRNIKSQESVHTVAGITWEFTAWERPFRLNAEVYNKILSGIVPYRLDNVRLIYTGDNSAEGYSRGIDFRLNGEFVEGAESWISLALMDSRLRIPGLIEDLFPSPSDQTLSMNIFFQDYLPGYPTWRAHVNISFATGIPVISPFNNRFDQFHRLPAYRRVDLGITKVIRSQSDSNSGKSFLKHFEEIVAGMEVFNLLDINNTVSYFWVKTINNLSGRSRQFAIPDYLTGRSLNFRLSAIF